MRVMDITEDTRFRPSDFNNEKYNGVAVFNREDCSPVIILMSKSSEPPHFLVNDGTKQMHYLHYSEAIDYCRSMGYTRGD